MYVLLIFLIGAPSWALAKGEVLPTTNEIDSTVENVLKTFLSPSNYASVANFHSKSSFAPKNYSKWNLTAIGTSILNEIKAFTEKLGISTFPNPNKSLKSLGMLQMSPSDSIYYELFSFPYEIIPIVMKTISTCQLHIKSNNYLSKGYIPLKLKLLETSNFPENLKTIGVINKSKNYIVKFSECLDSKPSIFDVPKAAINIAKHSPEVVGNIVRNRLKKPIPRHPQIKGQRYNEYEALTCQVLTTTNRMFENCLKELRKINNCVSRKMKSIKKRNCLSPSSVSFVRKFGNFSENCRFDGNLLVISCYNESNNKQKFDVIQLIKNVTGTSIPNDAIQSFGKEMVSFLFRNPFGDQFLDEFGTLAYVYHQGLERQKQLEKISRNNVNLRRKYEKFSKSLESYERNLISAAVSAINDVRAAATSVERTLVSSMSKILGMDFREHLRSIKCLHKLMDVIMSQILGSGNCDDNSEDEEQESEEGAEEHSSDEDQVEADGGTLETNGDYWDSGDDKSEEEATDNAIDLYSKPTKNLLNSMKRLVKTKIQRNANTIATLANTFLLATMFYECIAILAAAIYRPGSIENASFPTMIHEDPDEQNDNGPWDGRFTRSLGLPNKRGIDDSVNSSKYINYHNPHQD